MSGRRISQGGSLSKMLMPGTVAGAVYDPANRLTSWAGNTLAYDNNGNLTADGAATYSWNARDELLSTSNGTSSFAYDALGRRTSRTVAGAGISYLHDGMNPVLVNNDQMISGLGLDENYAKVSSGGATSFLSDGLGSTRSLLDASGASTAAYSYAPFGETAHTGSDDTPFQFTGRENDGASDLYYYRARYYSPRLGRFIQSDPIGLAGGMNTYSYVLGNPVSLVDPLGLIDIEIPGATGENSIHANPGRDVIKDPSARAEHPPAHVHLGSNDGPRVRLTDFAPYSDDDAKRMTRKQKAFCTNLTNKNKNLIRKRAKSVYKRGYFWIMVNGRLITNVSRVAGPFAALASYSENFSDVRACEYDPELEACPDE